MAAKKKTTAKTKKNLKNMDQAHGKTEEYQPSTLEQIWGDDGLGKYNTLSEPTYTEQLNEMSKVDMQAHATQVGIMPIDNVELMKTRLVKEFKKHVSLYRRPSHTPKDVKLNKELKDILGEGK